MSSDTGWFPGRVREIPVEECLELVAARRVGRISYCTDAGPVTVPVNHVVADGDLLFRTSPHSEMGRHLRTSPLVCYEVDDIDELDQSGWSVLIRGHATVIDPRERPPEAERPFPWAEGARVLHIRIHGGHVTGRRVTGS